MAKPAPAPEPSLMDRILKPLFDRIGLNGPAPLQASQKPQQTPAVKVDRELLKKQGWSDADIDWWIRTQTNITK
jgi:hypothetical protein